MLQRDNMNADAIYVRGVCLYYNDNIDKAYQHFQQVLRLAPDHVKAKEIYKVSIKHKFAVHVQDIEICNIHMTGIL